MTTMNQNVSSATSSSDVKVSVTNSAQIHRTLSDGGAWLLTVRNIDGNENYAFTSYRHAQKYLASEVVGKSRIRMVRNGETYTYEWTATWNK